MTNPGASPSFGSNPASSTPIDFTVSNPAQVVAGFKAAVVERIGLNVQGKSRSYQEYLTTPESDRSGDEANAVDQQFTRFVLEWLGFEPSDYDYNLPQNGQKTNRPDYIIRASVGTAFIWEDKNSTLDFDPDDHLKQMRRYSIGTAGYAVWSNMRRILAVRFLSGDTLRFETLADISIEQLFGVQGPLPNDEVREAQGTNLALFYLLFSRQRFRQFKHLVDRICAAKDETAFQAQTTTFDQPQAMRNFITGSRQALEHLRLVALSQIREALTRRDDLVNEEKQLRDEWESIKGDFLNRLNLPLLRNPIEAAIERLTPRLGEMNLHEVQQIWQTVEGVGRVGSGKVSASLRTSYDKWLERAVRINSALLALRFTSSRPFRVADAFQVWSERQSDQEDVRPETFAEQVAYVFFIRLLLVRVLEDKAILQPRLASNGGFLDWSSYVNKHFKELENVGILNENFFNILALKAGHYYLHFFQRVVFDWFQPDDFLMVEALEFLSRYNFQRVASDIIGFTYEEYIDRNARNRKGHFLTRDAVVDYMLDLLEYSGPAVIGRRILDPACGSGSFLVHAARRYRQALVVSLSRQNNLDPKGDEAAIKADPTLRHELAQSYLDALTSLFFGLELNPFACYLAEMNLLIQGLDDLYVLQQAGDSRPIERFQIFNTDSLDLPREVLDNPNLTDTPAQPLLVPDRLSDRLTDEAYPIKARLNGHAQGFFFIICNPPYVTSKRGFLEGETFRNSEFYKTALSGDTNLYLLFLRLGLYYMADHGRMVYIIPLTIFGDQSASAARKLFKTPPFAPTAAIRFYRGDVLFPGVDQAVGIVRVHYSQPDVPFVISGGVTVEEAQAAQFTTDHTKVLDVVPNSRYWQDNWLISSDPDSLNIWGQAKTVSSNFSYQLGLLVDRNFDRKQGDVNATFINPLRIGGVGSFANGNIAIYKGEDVKAFAPLPAKPSDWIRPIQSGDTSVSKEATRASQTLDQLKQLPQPEAGLVIREVARLNTRERLTSTWFERKADTPFAFTHETWRMLLKSPGSREAGKAVMALIGSKTIVYLYNLFSTNNHVSKDELDRVPTPDPVTFPETQLAELADKMLAERAGFEQKFVQPYGVKVPEFDSDPVYLPPSGLLAASPSLLKLRLGAWVGQGELHNKGATTRQVKILRERGLIEFSVSKPPLADVLTLFLSEPGRNEESWTQAQQWQLPDVVVAATWLTQYRQLAQEAQTNWDRFVALQKQADEVVANWYGFDPTMKAAIAAGLPWARRRRQPAAITPASATTAISVGMTNRQPVISSNIYAIGYDVAQQLLEVEFKSGDIYAYETVPLHVFAQFETASSKGSFYSQHIQGRYNSQKL